MITAQQNVIHMNNKVREGDENKPIPLRMHEVEARIEAGRKEMLSSECPYCSDPKKYQNISSDKPETENGFLIARVGKFWKRSVGTSNMLAVKSHFYGDHWRIHISGKQHFIERFKNFDLDILTFKSKYSPWSVPGPLFLTFLIAAAKDTEFQFSVCRITHKKSPLIVEAHKWFSHGTMVTVRGFPAKENEFTSADLDVIKEAMEFFRVETRGQPKITPGDVAKAIQELGSDATQAAVAKELGVTGSALRAWAVRSGMRNWESVKDHYRNTEYVTTPLEEQMRW